ncbi:glycosyltransferase [Methanoculleus sp. Wushi-C6]|uniref:Glycosyltransferase n=1 Tax=Methanoculleus caldifontis TaxID=2651577 RepID=A0ABU3X1U7_9EURY|nr:glycosyltransferase [Methanoculleus sp. Wushi-C6]MDV2482019.1 glycosyltransferase [Methanoculleus sp. Wushi-C6]
MISIVIPLYNERDNILTYKDELFPKVEHIAEVIGESFQYILIDDGSRDDTYPLIQDLARERSDVIAATNGTNKGMGAAIKHGLRYCEGDLVVTMDSDLTFRPEDIEGLVAAYRASHPDCVSGSPYLEQGLMEEVTFIRYLPSKVVNTLYQIALGAKITCVSPIFRLYKKEALDGMHIQSNNFEINAEILAKLILSGRSVVEIPVELHTRKYGESKINTRKEIVNHVRLLTKIARIRIFKGDWD